MGAKPRHLLSKPPQDPKPFLRWVGGKAKFAAEMAPAIKLLCHNRMYVEPFLGAGAMFLTVQPFFRAIINDVNLELMATYEAIKEDSFKVASLLQDLVECGIDEETYYMVRENEAEFEPGAERAARFIYLNKLCFNGIYRVNKSGEFNVPYGKLKKPAIPTAEDLLAVSVALMSNVELSCEDGIGIIERAESDWFLYVDPPYDGTYDSYTEGGFAEGDQLRLAEALYNAHQRGVRFIAHNSDTPDVQRFYEDWSTVMPWHEARSVAADAAKREKAACVVITNI